jgi:TRAP-type C4-dicarboxylate transport system substrate-binding protein
VQKYVNLTGHVWSYFVVSANDSFYKKLSAEHRKVFDEEAAKAI